MLATANTRGGEPGRQGPLPAEPVLSLVRARLPLPSGNRRDQLSNRTTEPNTKSRRVTRSIKHVGRHPAQWIPALGHAFDCACEERRADESWAHSPEYTTRMRNSPGARKHYKRSGNGSVTLGATHKTMFVKGVRTYIYYIISLYRYSSEKNRCRLQTRLGVCVCV